MKRVFEKSTNQLRRAEQTIPLGAQTFSKSRTQYPVGYAPLFASKGKGCHLWDIDGNRYVDLVAALGAVTIGYRNHRIDSAVRKQMRSGVTFSLSGVIESEVSELLLSLLPDAEMVRFAKNGSDVTSAAVRLARHITGKKKVVRSSYHGWHDWYIGSTSRNFGVPKEISDLTLVLPFNDLVAAEKLFDQHGNDISCIILEPVGMEFPVVGFLEGLRKLCDKYGALLIYDEVVTGLRISKNGSGQLFNVHPDLSCFGKGIANGFPLSAIVGKQQFMKELSEVFFSGTFGGETLSLAAAKEVLYMIHEDMVVDQLDNIGNEISVQVTNILDNLKIDFLKLSGHNSWKFLKWNLNPDISDQVKTLFLQEMFQEGVLVLNTHNVMTSITRKHINRVIAAYEVVLPKLQYSVSTGDFNRFLKANPIKPLFRLR